MLKLRHGEDVVAESPASALRIDETEDAVMLDTVALKLEVLKKRFRLLDRVRLDRDGDGRYADKERVTASQGAGIEVTTPNGDVFRADSAPCQIRIEQRGPLRAGLRHKPPPEVSAATFLGSFAIAYESNLTGKRAHRRILRESLKTGIAAARSEIAEGKWDGWSGAHSLCFRFTPYALAALDNEE